MPTQPKATNVNDAPGTMRGLSIHQPWAWAIFNAPHPKNIENRTWKPPDWILYQRILIQSSRMVVGREYEAAARYVELVGGAPPPRLQDLPRGAIVGSVLVRGYVNQSERSTFGGLDPQTWKHAQYSPWFEGPIGWILEQPIACEPVPFKARQWLFKVPTSVVESLKFEAGATWARS